MDLNTLIKLLTTISNKENSTEQEQQLPEELLAIKEALETTETIINSKIIETAAKHIVTLFTQGIQEIGPPLQQFSNFTTDLTIKEILKYKNELGISVQEAIELYTTKLIKYQNYANAINNFNQKLQQRNKEE